METVFNHDCAAAAETTSENIARIAQCTVCSREQLEGKIADIGRELRVLRTICFAWQGVEAEDALRVDENHPLAKMFGKPIMEETTTETTNQEGDNA